MGDPSPTRVATLGAALSANKGAASMLYAVVQNLPEYLGQCSFDVLTTYPDADASEPTPGDIRLVSATPMVTLVMFPLALLVWALAKLRLPTRWLMRVPAMRAIADADVVVDLAGISFSDGRGIPTLGYNVLMTSIPLLLGRPVVKASQALGPFRDRANRLAARAVLPHVTTICARGASTEANLAELGLANVVRAADLAFTMHDSPQARQRMESRLKGLERPVAVLPSSVVHEYCERTGIDYPGVMASFIDRLAVDGHHVLLAPHSARPGAGAGRMNDLPVCRTIYDRLATPQSCTFVDKNLAPDELRALIGASVITVTSRFHAMISALATATPVMVVGWSHKYQEVLDDVGVEGCAIDYPSLTVEELALRFADIERRRGAIIGSIERSLPAIREQSRVSYSAIAAAAGHV